MVIPFAMCSVPEFLSKMVTVFMSAFKSTDPVLAGESDNGDQNQSSCTL